MAKQKKELAEVQQSVRACVLETLRTAIEISGVILKAKGTLGGQKLSHYEKTLLRKHSKRGALELKFLEDNPLLRDSDVLQYFCPLLREEGFLERLGFTSVDSLRYIKNFTKARKTAKKKNIKTPLFVLLLYYGRRPIPPA